MAGGVFVKVDPRYKLTCSSCGHVAKRIDKLNLNLECVECGFSENADINASRNV